MSSLEPILGASVSKTPTGEATLAAIRASSMFSTRVQVGSLRLMTTFIGPMRSLVGQPLPHRYRSTA